MALTSVETNRIKFDRTGRGYGRREVTRFKRRISAALLAVERNLGEPTGLTSTDIESVTFPWVIGGFDYEEVDAFLDRAARALRIYESVNPESVPHSPISVPKPRLEHLTHQELADANFTVVFRGYNIAAVDRFTARVGEALAAYERGESSILADASEVSRKVFDISMRGYSETQVDAILDRAAATLRTYEGRQRRRIV